MFHGGLPRLITNFFQKGGVFPWISFKNACSALQLICIVITFDRYKEIFSFIILLNIVLFLIFIFFLNHAVLNLQNISIKNMCSCVCTYIYIFTCLLYPPTPTLEKFFPTMLCMCTYVCINRYQFRFFRFVSLIYSCH